MTSKPVSAGWYSSVALRQDGSLVSWGNDEHNQVSDTPEGYDFVVVLAGERHSTAIRQDGSIVVWGRNDPVKSQTPDRVDF